MEHYLGVAEDEGVTSEEVGAVQGICMAVSAGKVNAQLRDVENRRKK